MSRSAYRAHLSLLPVLTLSFLFEDQFALITLILVLSTPTVLTALSLVLYISDKSVPRTAPPAKLAHLPSAFCCRRTSTMVELNVKNGHHNALQAHVQ